MRANANAEAGGGGRTLVDQLEPRGARASWPRGAAERVNEHSETAFHARMVSDPVLDRERNQFVLPPNGRTSAPGRIGGNGPNEFEFDQW